VRFAYADPPYPGQSKKHYGDHPDYAGEVDHPALIAQLVAEYPDGWALRSVVTHHDRRSCNPKRHIGPLPRGEGTEE